MLATKRSPIFLTSLLALHALSSPIALEQRQVSVPLKRGLAWGGETADIRQYERNQNVGWFYTWNPQNWVQYQHKLEFVPMLWGSGEQINTFPLTVNQTSLSNGVIRNELGMNEPEQPGQSNLTPQAAAQMWLNHVEPVKSWNSSARLGSPAMSAATISKQWLADFTTVCKTPVGANCSVDFLALHWYGKNATRFIEYMVDMHTFFQKNIWVTEFACHEFGATEVQCTYDEAVIFMNTTQAWLDATPYIERYAWFGAMKKPAIDKVNALMNPTGIINNLGLQYIGLRNASQNIGGLPSTTSPLR